MPDTSVHVPAPSLPSERPNFTGDWRTRSADNLSAYLLRQGVPAEKIDRALQANQQLTLHIVHSYNRFTVTTNAYTVHYNIVNAAPPPPNTDTDNDANVAAAGSPDADDTCTDEQSLADSLTSNDMEWNGDQLSVLSGVDGRQSHRQMIDGRLIITQSIDDVTAVVSYQRVTVNE